MIPKTVSASRITENLESTKLKLSEEDMTRLTAIDKDFRLFRVKLSTCISAVSVFNKQNSG